MLLSGPTERPLRLPKMPAGKSLTAVLSQTAGGFVIRVAETHPQIPDVDCLQYERGHWTPSPGFKANAAGSPQWDNILLTVD